LFDVRNNIDFQSSRMDAFPPHKPRPETSCYKTKARLNHWIHLEMILRLRCHLD